MHFFALLYCSAWAAVTLFGGPCGAFPVVANLGKAAAADAVVGPSLPLDATTGHGDDGSRSSSGGNTNRMRWGAPGLFPSSFSHKSHGGSSTKATPSPLSKTHHHGPTTGTKAAAVHSHNSRPGKTLSSSSSASSTVDKGAPAKKMPHVVETLDQARLEAHSPPSFRVWKGMT